MFDLKTTRIAILGLGYVGLPLAVEFGKKYLTTGFDISTSRIAALKAGHDHTLEVDDAELAAAHDLSYADDVSGIADCNVYIVTVPTPIDVYKRPDLSPLLSASRTVGSVLKPGDLVIFESTVYPGATEEDCVPVLEAASGLRFNEDFFVGYSPERINPGDKAHRLPDIAKVTSGSTPDAADFVNRLYQAIITAGTHLAPSIRVAEAAKVIENTQRDVNIALMNELSLIFEKLGIDTLSVLEAAGTKWNFLPFRPGLVGGHCIGVDPYYLTHKAQSVGHHPEMILSGRRINDSMGEHVATKTVLELLKRNTNPGQLKVLVMGLTFKENCPDLRNTRVMDVIGALQNLNIDVDVMDPWADPAEAKHEYALDLQQDPKNEYDAVIMAVAHEQFVAQGQNCAAQYLRSPAGIIFDVKGILPAAENILRL